MPGNIVVQLPIESPMSNFVNPPEVGTGRGLNESRSHEQLINLNNSDEQIETAINGGQSRPRSPTPIGHQEPGYESDDNDKNDNEGRENHNSNG